MYVRNVHMYVGMCVDIKVCMYLCMYVRAGLEPCQLYDAVQFMMYDTDMSGTYKHHIHTHIHTYIHAHISRQLLKSN